MTFSKKNFTNVFKHNCQEFLTDAMFNIKILKITLFNTKNCSIVVSP